MLIAAVAQLDYSWTQVLGTVKGLQWRCAAVQQACWGRLGSRLSRCRLHTSSPPDCTVQHVHELNHRARGAGGSHSCHNQPVMETPPPPFSQPTQNGGKPVQRNIHDMMIVTRNRRHNDGTAQTQKYGPQTRRLIRHSRLPCPEEHGSDQHIHNSEQAFHHQLMSPAGVYKQALITESHHHP